MNRHHATRKERERERERMSKREKERKKREKEKESAADFLSAAQTPFERHRLYNEQQK
jgi:hypothetical protein